LPTNQNADEQVEGISNSIVALDQLIHDATEMGEDQLGFDFVHQLAQVAKHVKADMSGMQSAKEKAEAKCNATSAADEDMEYELASSRESLREARDQLLDSREEAEQLQTEVASLRLELEKRSGRKRAYDDRSESEEDEDEGGDDDDDDDDEEDFHSPNSKRHREDFFDDSVPV
jgi:chromosome segregation ATPase